MERRGGYIRLILLGALLFFLSALWRSYYIDGTKASVSQLAKAPQEASRIALTFDDGPNSIYTEKLLDGLLKRGVKASFFLMGKNISGNEELVKRMHEEGHLIGNHTFDHVQLTKVSEAEACSQILKTSNAIYEITGEYTTFVRPPFGSWRENLDCVVTMIPVLWTVDPVDWNTTDVDLIVRRVEKVAEDEDIILLHDNYDSSVEAALRIVDDLTKQGFEFVTVDELILE